MISVLAMPKSKPTSVRAYARHRGCTHQAVRKAIHEGRLEASITHVKGKPKIADIELADKEWEAKTSPQASANPRDESADAYSASRARRETALADIAEIELATRRGRFVDVEEVTAQYAAEVTAVKTKLLGIPTHLRQRHPHIPKADVDAVEAEIRAALEEFAGLE